MLGEKIGSGTGKMLSRRVLPNPAGGIQVETSFQSNTVILGVEAVETGTYTASMRPDGSLFGTGQGLVVGKDGDVGTWVGHGVGTIKPGGIVSYRGAIFLQSASPKWARLNNVAVLFEYEIDTQGNTKSELFEWK